MADRITMHVRTGDGPVVSFSVIEGDARHKVLLERARRGNLSIVDAETPKRPPTSGPGSGKAAWIEYAESIGVEVTGNMTREDIVSAVEAA